MFKPNPIPNRTVYLDLDGVMCGFREHFEASFGFGCRDVDEDEMWRLVHTNLNFFRELPILPGAAAFFERLYGAHLDGKFNLAILTACPRDNYKIHAIAKKDWVAVNLAKDLQVMPVFGHGSKGLFKRSDGDILIDDWSGNIRNWTSHGGIGVLHTDFESTSRHLLQLGIL
jgi:hypothetical protein